MSEVKRYDCTNGKAQHCYGCYEMTESAEGDYVSSADFDAQRLRVDTVEALATERLAAWEKCAEFRDAAELRADTAEAELKDLRVLSADQGLNLKRVKREFDSMKIRAEAAEQRIADTTAKLQLAADMLDDDERGNRFAQALRIAIAALNPNPEAESHEKH